MTLPGHAHPDLRERQFTVTSDAELGFPGLRDVIGERLFRRDVLVPVADEGGPVRDRYRIKDVMRYRRDGEKITLAEIAEDRNALVRLEHVPRFRFLDVPGCEGFAEALLNLIPPEFRHEEGTFGVHCFRSFTSVVDQPHQDGFEYGIAYVVSREGGGAVSYLDMLGTRERVLERQLQAGELVLFRDSAFLHGATPLEGPSPRRDALVIQFDAPEDLQGAAMELAEAAS